MIMTPALLLPLCFVDTANINNGFDGNFAGAQLEDWQTKQCYFQKWQLSDTLKLQLIAEAPVNDLVIYNLDQSIADTVPWVLSAITLPDYPTYGIYEISYPFTTLGVGRFVIQQDQFEAEAIDVADEWPNTVLFTYKNSTNDYSVVFDTGFEFNYRVEGWIGDYKPKNDRDVYNDQIRNLTQLNSIAYRQFSLKIGYKWGVPNKFLDKVNIITQCDQISIDGVPYQPIQDSEFEVENNTDNNFIGGSIDIEPVTNNFLRFVTAGNLPNQTYTPNQVVTPYLNSGADFNVTGLFTFNSLLEAIAIYRISNNPITLNFGTTPNGSEIGTIVLNQTANSLQLNWLFLTSTTVYISGIQSGDNVSIWLIWKQLDALPIPISGGGGASTELGAGAIINWLEPSPGDFLLNWDMSTGLGKANTKWTKWCILGTNGTIDADNAYFQQIKTADIISNYATLGTIIGTNQKLIPRSALPAEALFTMSADVNASPGDTVASNTRVARAGTGGGDLAYEARKGASAATLGKTDNMGDGDLFDVTPKSVISLYIFKLVD